MFRSICRILSDQFGGEWGAFLKFFELYYCIRILVMNSRGGVPTLVGTPHNPHKIIIFSYFSVADVWEDSRATHSIDVMQTGQ